MNAAKYILVALSLALLVGCVVREDRGGPAYNGGQGGFQYQDRAPEQGRAPEQWRGPEQSRLPEQGGDYQFRPH